MATGDSADHAGELIVDENLHGLLREGEGHTHGLLDGLLHGGDRITSHPRAAA
jgi:hypothetical protein